MCAPKSLVSRGLRCPIGFFQNMLSVETNKFELNLNMPSALGVVRVEQSFEKPAHQSNKDLPLIH